MIISFFLMQSAVKAGCRGEIRLVCISKLLLRLLLERFTVYAVLTCSLSGPAERTELTELYYLFQ